MFSSPAASAIAIGGAYLCGSIPFGLLIGKWAKGIDLREHGSRNIGATNASRVLGTKWGLLVLSLDALKGLLPTLIFPRLVIDSDLQMHVTVACGVAAILGHMFPCWLGFRGGKGVATSLGVVGVIAPWATLVAVGIFIMTLLSFQYVSLSSILAAFAFAVTEMVLLWPEPFSDELWSRGLFGLGIPLLVIVRHRSNIGRLWKGEERKFRQSAPQ